MESDQEFVDYYALLQVSPNCDELILEKAYRHSAKLYHPDQSDSADADKFQEIVEAYEVLKDPAKRARYDLIYAARAPHTNPIFANGEEPTVSQEAASQDADIHETILAYLYKQRRENADDPGVLGFDVRQAIGCSEDSFEFHVWYLKNKDFVRMSEQGMLAITVEGVDHVISTSQSDEVENLLIAKAKND